MKNRAFIDWIGFSSGTCRLDDKSFMEPTNVHPVPAVFQGNLAVAEITVIDPATTTFVKSADPVEGTIMLPGEKITYTISGETETASTRLSPTHSTAVSTTCLDPFE